MKNETKRKITDMSSSSASPKLKKPVGRAEKIKKIQEVTRTLPMSAGKVSLLSRYFEDADQAVTMMKKKPGNNNNSRLYDINTKSEARNIPLGSTSHSPEMSLQSDNRAKPMGRLHFDHVTTELLRQPMGADNYKQHGTEEGCSHVGKFEPE